MMALRWISPGMIGLALAAGTLSDGAPERRPVFAGGYRVLAADFHVHVFPMSAGTLAPWDVAIEAGRQGLDAIAITAHNQVVWGLIGRWFSRTFGGPIVLAGEEIHGPRFHLIAAGIHRTISWRLTAVQAIDEVHRQGGVAIAAHPDVSFWPGFLAGGAINKLDGAEAMHPIALVSEDSARQLREFYERSHAAAIGSSDYHGMGPVGVCRTFVFVREASECGILEAIRAKRTVVLDGARAYGDPALAKLVAGGGPPAALLAPVPAPWRRFLALFSVVSGTLGMLGLALARLLPCTMEVHGNSDAIRIP